MGRSMDILERLQNAIYHESAAVSPRTTTLIEAARDAAYEIASLRGEARADKEEIERLRHEARDFFMKIAEAMAVKIAEAQ